MTISRVRRAATALFVPTVAWICYLFLLLPSLIVLPISFSPSIEMEFPPKELSLALYRQFFSDPAWWGSTTQSLLIACLTMVVTVVLSVPAAYALQRSKLPAVALVNAMVMGPLLVPVIVLALGLYLQLAPWGMLNNDISLFLCHAMLAVPFMMISVGASLRHIDPALETAALIMGASKQTIFFRVVLPQLRTGIAAGALFAFLISLDEVIVAYFITGPETQTLPVKMYSAIRWELSPVIAAVSSLLTVVSLVIAVVMMVLQKEKRT